MRRSNRIKRILCEQSGHPYTGRGQERKDVHDKIDAELHTVGLQHTGAAITQKGWS